MRLAGMHNIHTASMAYTTAYRDHFPDKITLGGYGFRRAPGERDPNDPRSLPETFGLAAVLQKTKNMTGQSNVWVCPDAPEWMKEYKVTFAFSIAQVIADHSWTELQSSRKTKMQEDGTYKFVSLTPAFKTWWVWDNYTMMPYDSGWRAKTPIPSGYTIPEDRRYYPHSYNDIKYAGGVTRACNCVYLDGHAAPIRFQD